MICYIHIALQEENHNLKKPNKQKTPNRQRGDTLSHFPSAREGVDRTC